MVFIKKVVAPDEMARTPTACCIIADKMLVVSARSLALIPRARISVRFAHDLAHPLH